MTEQRDFEDQLVVQVRELLGPAHGVSLRGSYPETQLIVTKPERPEREILYPIWGGDFSQPPGFEDVNDTAVLIYSNVIEYEHR
jgi:hypothetical protein